MPLFIRIAETGDLKECVYGRLTHLHKKRMDEKCETHFGGLTMIYIIISLAVAWVVCFGILVFATWRKQPKQWAAWFPQLVIGLQLALAAVLFIHCVTGGG